MITPTPRLVVLLLAGAPVGWAVGAVFPAYQWAAAIWVALLLLAAMLDAGLAPSGAALALDVNLPETPGVGGAAEAVAVRASFRTRAPARVEVALEANDRLAVSPPLCIARGEGKNLDAEFDVRAVRRGLGRLERVWLRWAGPLGLARRQAALFVDRGVTLEADFRGVREVAMRMFSQDSQAGNKAQFDVGDGGEFNALREYQPGMDLRAADWKQSARHNKVLVKEFRTERNHPIILALDTGRLMCEPVAGLARMDRALNAALLLAYVSLKIGDRVGLFAFDAQPRVATGTISGVNAFALLRRQAAAIDYSTEETNFTLGLATLQTALDRRSMIIILTEFADPTSAELMLESVGRLLRRHAVLFVVLRDDEVESLARARPAVSDDVARAVVADAIWREREAVMARLRRLGADILEAPAGSLGPALLDRYLAAKRSARL